MSQEFEARIEAGDRGGAYVEIPDAVQEALGGAGRIPVRAFFDGLPYSGSIVRSDGRMVLGVVREIREALRKGPGDSVLVSVELDEKERTVVVPVDLEEALAQAPAARDFFGTLSYTCRKEYVNWITEARKPETRERRIGGAIEMLREGKKL